MGPARLRWTLVWARVCALHWCHQSVSPVYACAWLGVSAFTDKISTRLASQAWNGKGEPMSLLHSWKSFICLTQNLLPSTCSAQCPLLFRLLSSLLPQVSIPFFCKFGQAEYLEFVAWEFCSLHDLPDVFPSSPWLLHHQSSSQFASLSISFHLSGITENVPCRCSVFPHSPFPCGFNWINWIFLTSNPLS